MIPQSAIDNFKSDPLGSVTAMVNDPKSVLKSIKIPDSVKSLSDMVPQSIKDKIVPKELQNLVGIAPSATVPHIDTAEKPESVTPETSPQPPASSRKIDIAPPVRRAMTPEPITEEKDVKAEAVTGVVEDGGILITEPKKEEKEEPPSTILKIDPADLEAVQALLNSRNAAHTVIQSNTGSITAEARL
jgi:hypothetical protein